MRPFRRLLGVLIALAFALTLAHAQGQLSGTVKDRETGLPLTACAVSSGSYGTTTDSLGRYALTLPFGSLDVTFRYVGYVPLTRRISLTDRHPTARLDIRLASSVLTMREVTVEQSQPDETPTVQKMEPTDVRNMPTVYNDVLRSIQILPGASANNELSSAYNVRGGNYDENLIYLNGYEINRPYLLRQGVEESQSLLNSDMTDRLNFYGGAFPATLGDKMSSALEVDYVREHPRGLGGVLRADLLGQGLTLHQHAGKLDWSIGGRYSNPNLLVSSLQTSGTYRPSFLDGQLFANYLLPGRSRVELFALSASNRFDLIPKEWEGNFTGINYQDVRAVDIVYRGQRSYTWRSSLAGLKYEKVFGPRTRLSLAGAYLYSTEAENTDLSADVFYNPYAWEHGAGYYLKSRIERNHNRLALNTLQFLPALHHTAGAHSLVAGLDLRAVTMQSHINEFLQDYGDSTVQDSPVTALSNHSPKLNSGSAYVQDVIALAPYLRLDLGLRATRYGYTKETLISPRGGIYFNPTASSTLSLAAGVYYQPPFYYELSRLPDTVRTLKSQRAIHLLAGWEHQTERGLVVRTEVFYKKLDNLIPYTLDGLRILYTDQNSARGYAYGTDILLHGELTQHLNSWISYGFLNTKERDAAAGSQYRRRLLDQTHTLRLFLQDQMPEHPNVQVHNRMLFGSGYLYHPQIMTQDAAGHTVAVTDYTQTRTFPMYFRADVGFSIRWKSVKHGETILIVEVLNAFNRANVSGFSFFPIFPSDPAPQKIPEVLSGRFFNFGVEYHLN
ncbi:MAG TPA: TonB-dependent receptor [bacterium]|jgi:hypothetical protein